MEFKLSKEQKRLKKDIACFAKEQLKDDTLAVREGKNEFSRSLWDTCGEQRIQGLHVPEEYGGKGYDAVQLALAMEALGNGCDDAGLLISLGAQMLSCQVPLLVYGSATQKQRYLPSLSDGSWIAASALNEAEAGSDYDNMATTAVADGADFVLNGEKTMLVNAPVANVALVYAVTDAAQGFDGGVTCYLVDLDAPGISKTAVGGTIGYRTAPMGGLVFKDVRVAGDAVLGAVGQGAAVYNAGATWERALLSAMHIGRMDYLLEAAIMHARTRKAGGKPIGKNQSISHRITDMKIRLEVGRLLSYKAAWSLDNNPQDQAAASIAKLFSSESMVQSTLDAGQIFGGAAFVEGSQSGRSLHDAFGSTLYAGTAAMQRNAIARAMGLV